MFLNCGSLDEHSSLQFYYQFLGGNLMGRLADNMLELKQKIDSSHNQRIDLINNLQQDRKNLSVSVEDTLNDNNHQRMSEFNKVMGGIKDTIKDVRNDTMKRTEYISDMRKNINIQRDQLRKDLKQNSQKELSERKKYLADLQQSVLKIRNDTQAAQKEIQDDLSLIRSVWSGKKSLQNAMDADTKVKKKAVSQPLKKKDLETESSTANNNDIKPDSKTSESNNDQIKHFYKADKDDLTQIIGIGYERQRLLNNSGVFTFKQFAQTSADTLSEILGKHTGLNEINKWIKSAIELAKTV